MNIDLLLLGLAVAAGIGIWWDAKRIKNSKVKPPQVKSIPEMAPEHVPGFAPTGPAKDWAWPDSTPPSGLTRLDWAEIRQLAADEQLETVGICSGLSLVAMAMVLIVQQPDWWWVILPSMYFARRWILKPYEKKANEALAAVARG